MMSPAPATLTSGVAMITFNGMKFLQQQLDSIVAQTCPVGHLVISDDGSTDGTWDYLQQWAAQAPIRVTLIRNEQQLGLIANFEQAASRVEADIIFSCDQDDVWVPDKVALFQAVFSSNPKVQLVHSDAILIDAHGDDLGATLFGELAISAAEHDALRAGNAFAVYSRRNIVTGAATAFRKTLLDLARPLPEVTYHDAWLALIAAATGETRLLATPTIYYRQHGTNLVGVKKASLAFKLRRFWWEINGPRPLKTTTDRILAFRTTLQERLAILNGVAPGALALAAQGVHFARCRAHLPRRAPGRVIAVSRTISSGTYREFAYEPWFDAMRDILNR